MRILSSDKRHVRRLCACAMTAAAALMISYVEHLLPSFVPLPGVKPGFANIAVTLAFAISPSCALAVSLVRIFTFALLFGTPVSLAMSLCGGLFSYFFLFVAHRVHPRRVSFVGLSVLSAFFHNAGQLVAAALLADTVGVIAYLPVLTLSGAVCGTLSGLLLNYVYPSLSRYIKKAV